MNTLSGFKADESLQRDGSELKHNLAHLIIRAYASELIFPRMRKPPVLLVERIGAFPSSGDILRPVKEGAELLAKIKHRYTTDALEIREDNGLSLVFADWRFSLSLWGNGHVARLNVESRGDIALMQLKTSELLQQIEAETGQDS